MSVQLIVPTRRKARRFTPQQKLQVLREWERSGNGVEVAEKYQIHPQTLYRWRKALEQGAQAFLSGKKTRVDPRIKKLEREPETEGSPGSADPRADAFKKRDELALTNRPTGATYSQEQRRRIVEEVQRLRTQGFSISETLRGLGVCRSTYYGWLKPPPVRKKSASVLGLTAEEQYAIIEKKKAEPQLSHRQISGSLRQVGSALRVATAGSKLSAGSWPPVCGRLPGK